MKNKEILKKFDIDRKSWTDAIKKDFHMCMKNEFQEFLTQRGSEWNLSKYRAAVNDFQKSRWDAISNKVVGGIPEYVWNKFYAMVVCPTREKLCPKEVAAAKAHREEEHKKYLQREARRQEIRKSAQLGFLFAALGSI